MHDGDEENFNNAEEKELNIMVVQAGGREQDP